MAPVPSKIEPRVVPGTEWISYNPATGEEIGRGGVFIEPNIDTTCFSIRSIEANTEPGEEDLIHFCDWPELRATIDQFMADRAKEAGPDE